MAECKTEAFQYGSHEMYIAMNKEYVPILPVGSCNGPIATYTRTNLCKSRQRINVVGMDFDQIVHEEEQQR